MVHGQQQQQQGAPPGLLPDSDLLCSHGWQANHGGHALADCPAVLHVQPADDPQGASQGMVLPAAPCCAAGWFVCARQVVQIAAVVTSVADPQRAHFGVWPAAGTAGMLPSVSACSAEPATADDGLGWQQMGKGQFCHASSSGCPICGTW